MKLDRCAIVLSVAALAMACGTRTPAKSAAAPPSPTVSTTRLMAAELRDADDAPKVGKSQHSAVVEDEQLDKAVPHRRDDRRPGGGFSGYK